MIHEYALEPELVATWIDRQIGRYFIGQFGIGQPRIESRYPKGWKKLVWEEFRSSNEIERKRMEELLARLSEAMVKRPGAQWDSEKDWLGNAERVHGLLPFHAILARANPREHDQVLVGADLDDMTPLWVQPRGLKVRRSAQELAEAVEAMLRNANEIVFVDPHFGPENRRYLEPLRAFLRAALANRRGAIPDRVEVQCSLKPDVSESRFRRECESRLLRVVPRGMRMDLIRLRERREGECMHNRYILTDLGGVTIGVGLDIATGMKSGQTDDIQLLDRKPYEKRWSQYASENPAFDRPETPVTIYGEG